MTQMKTKFYNQHISIRLFRVIAFVNKVRNMKLCNWYSSHPIFTKRFGNGGQVRNPVNLQQAHQSYCHLFIKKNANLPFKLSLIYNPIFTELYRYGVHSLCPWPCSLFGFYSDHIHRLFGQDWLKMKSFSMNKGHLL